MGKVRNMDVLYQLVLERNVRETKPFEAVHEAYTTLFNQFDSLQAKCDALEREIANQQQQLDDLGPMNEGRGATSSSAALKNETRLRDKLEKLQEELNSKLQAQADEQAIALKTTKELSDVKDVNAAQATTISKLEDENQRKDKAIDHMTEQLTDANSLTKLAEAQYGGLKDSIRVLQEENDLVKKENRELESRFVREKTALSDEMNSLTELVESLKKELDMLRSLKVQEEKRKSWFGYAASENTCDDSESKKSNESNAGRKWGDLDVVIPSAPKQILQAHASEACCIRYDEAGTDLVATGSSDSTVKVWDGSNGTLKATLRSGGSNSIIDCNISNGVVVAGGTDKTCRVWNLRTERMIHHLVGHAHKITGVRLFGNERGVITSSADRSLKVWDISRKTYRQTATLRHSSTANCIDVGTDGCTCVSGHKDGGLRLWDVQTGERTGEISNMHEGGITSVQFHPVNAAQLLTNGMDSCLKIVDIRNGSALHVLRDPEFQTSYAWASCRFSPDGRYIGAGSSSSGVLFIWDTQAGELQRKLTGHETGVCGFGWGRGGTSGQQVASVDRDGTLILWA